VESSLCAWQRMRKRGLISCFFSFCFCFFVFEANHTCKRCFPFDVFTLAPPNRPAASPTLSGDVLPSLTVRQLKSAMSDLGVSAKGCTEKADLINALKAALAKGKDGGLKFLFVSKK
jgi:hypothetical protein